MDNERDYRAEYEALLKQYEEDKKQEQEEPYDFAAEYEKEKMEKYNNITSSIVLILFFLTLGLLIIGKSFFGPHTIFGILILFFGLTYFIIGITKDPFFAITMLILFSCSSIMVFRGNITMMLPIFPGTMALCSLSATIKNTKPLIQLLRKMKPLKKSCTEKVTAICINPNQRDRDDLLKENIEVIPRCILVKRRTRKGTRTKTTPLYVLFSPVYELDYYGTKYTLCDNYYGITKTEEGESREILINPENPQEFYDKKRYKSDVRQILKTIPIIDLLIMMPVFIATTAAIILSAIITSDLG